MKRVLVAMSGGVDSSVAAALLLKQGYFVAGAYMKNFSAESWQGVVEADCPWKQDVKDVQEVCERLGIEFRSFNFEKEYQEKVVEYFFAEYAAGRTPNPDIMCNKEIKFGLFLQKAVELGFDYVATGHYARLRPIKNPKSKTKIYDLLRGTDYKKDQSYFLYTLTQKQLSRILFPIGEYKKSEVRQLASKLGLPNWDKKDSQGVCSVGRIKLREFLRQRIPERTGQIVEAGSGKILGTHQGAWYYTIGQREGIGIGGGYPYYVVQKDVVANKITVATRQKYQLVHSKHATAKNIHWINPYSNLPVACKAKIRYQQPDQYCNVFYSPGDGEGGGEVEKLYVEFAEPQFAIAPGQSIVFYLDDRVLGGGIIEFARPVSNILFRVDKVVENDILERK